MSTNDPQFSSEHIVSQITIFPFLLRKKQENFAKDKNSKATPKQISFYKGFPQK
ncbi:Uncharacterized protein dnm_046330 [Desulfonema magnum]|uniref:Uncharacterized protein n=1 Tax=Desulfonema magnum TaxID=45655 RepID=A0A975GP29_9BACT|nr:Uncharacterized protein dnm_046330 [Desulfonema magnum]